MKLVQIGNVKIGEGQPKIIVPMVGKTDKELLDEAESIVGLQPDIVEWRVDKYEGVEQIDAVISLLETLKKVLIDIPILFTFRTIKEGGDCKINHSFYWTLLEAIAKTGQIELIDVELFYDKKDKIKEFIEKAQRHNTKVVISNHDFTKTPSNEELSFRLYQMEKLGADILKIAVMPQSSRDVLNLMHITLSARENGVQQPMITMAMGQLGMISRFSGELFGSAATFAAGKQASAPGQVDIHSLRKGLSLLRCQTE
ncbi:type I 3-dehydroquinate dehydratase [Virgibacillus halodenitrificans]|uniref:type I 3-dehydroquinate dehydratase n=1 Tax=Virgibacillus halodenitrificans TaxID=1482 RepID=UPI00030CAE43|nr:type I 3-dehydroquinate dehydratase [Virgibacillus halodenitrificans]